MKKNIGKNTLGDNDKMSVSLREYDRSTHDLSYAWRSSMGVGSLVPCLKLLAMPGDNFNINIENKVMTHPTIGPLFGSYKLQVDVFTCPIRLYNAQLHNNALNIGLDMSKVKLPKLMVQENCKTNSSSIYNYLGLKYGKKGKKVNAVPYLAVYDIFKNYYANKQEEYFYILRQGNTTYNLETGIVGEKANISNNTIVNQKEIVIDYDRGLLINQLNKGNSYVKTERITNATGGQQVPSLTAEIHLSNEKVRIVQLDKSGKTRVIIEAGATWSINRPAENLTVNLSDVRLFVDYVNEIKMNPYKLDVIDELREELLSKGKQEVLFGGGGNTTNVLMNDLVNTMENSGVLHGLPLKTHFSDIYNNWINKEWVDGDNGIAAVTAIDTSTGSFSIDTLSLAQKVYNLLNRIAVSGGTYKDWIETVYTTDYYFRAETPIYEGGMSAEIEFSEVVSTAATEIQNNEALGTLGGKGYSNNNKGGTISIKVNEPAYIIAIASITPRVDYSQGNDWDNDLDTMNDIHKPQLDGIGYQDLMEKWMHGGANEQAAIGKTVAWINYMTNVNKSYGNFAVGENESYMCLNRVYELGADGEIVNGTTYINPKEFTGTFATNELGNMDFWVQLGFGIEARRVMSAKQIPIM